MARRLFNVVALLSLAALLLLWIAAGLGHFTHERTVLSPNGSFLYGYKWTGFYVGERFIHLQPLSALLGFAPAYWLVRRAAIWAAVRRAAAMRGRLLAANRCASCGYSMKWNVSGVCPECGTATAGTATT